MRKRSFVIMLVALALVLGACGPAATTAPTTAPAAQPTATRPPAGPATVAPTTAAAATTAPTAAAQKLKIGLVTDTGGVNDKSFNQSAWAGVQKAQKDFGVEGKFIESKQPTDYEKNIDLFVNAQPLLARASGCSTSALEGLSRRPPLSTTRAKTRMSVFSRLEVSLKRSARSVLSIAMS